MRWAPENIAWHCIHAGWPRDLIALATAHALIASEGEDSYQWPDPPTSYASHTGLWAVSTLGWSQPGRAELSRPTRAATDALERHRIARGAWTWCPAAHRADVAQLAAELGDVAARATPALALPVPPERGWQPRALMNVLEYVQRLRRNLPHGPIRP